MATIEVCDICRKEVTNTDGISVECTDWDGLSWIANSPIRDKRKYKVRICNRCKENIIKYCRKNKVLNV